MAELCSSFQRNTQTCHNGLGNSELINQKKDYYILIIVNVNCLKIGLCKYNSICINVDVAILTTVHYADLDLSHRLRRFCERR